VSTYRIVRKWPFGVVKLNVGRCLVRFCWRRSNGRFCDECWNGATKTAWTISCADTDTE